MREIKFRAWDTITERYYYNVQDTHDSSISDSFQNILDNDDLFIEQYTGLKDKNGVEIYENDVVRCSRGCPHKVVWEEERGGMFGGGMPGWYLSGLDEGYAWTNSEEVVGNINENADLLEEQLMELMLSVITNTIYLGNTKKDGTMSLNGRRDYTKETSDIMMNWFRYSGYHETKHTDANTGKVKRAMFYSDDPEKIKQIESILLPELSDTDRISPDDIGNDIHEFLHGGEIK